MQKFTRSLTREIEIGGERVAVTLDAEGVTLRPVGSRRTPHTLSWVSVVCAAAQGHPSPDQIGQAVQALKKGAEKAPAAAPAAEAHHAPAAPAAEMRTNAASAPVPAGEAPAPAASAATSSGLDAVLARIDGWLAKHRAGFHAGLLPGATDAECDALASALGAPLPGDLRALLKWHNGQSAEVAGAFERNYFLLSTDQIAETNRDLTAEPRAGWKPGLIPFLDDEQDNYGCLDTTRPGTPVVESWHGKAEPTVTSPSLKAWLEDFAAAMEKGEYYEEPERGSFRKKS